MPQMPQIVSVTTAINILCRLFVAPVCLHMAQEHRQPGAAHVLQPPHTDASRASGAQSLFGPDLGHASASTEQGPRLQTHMNMCILTCCILKDEIENFKLSDTTQAMLVYSKEKFSKAQRSMGIEPLDPLWSFESILPGLCAFVLGMGHTIHCPAKTSLNSGHILYLPTKMIHVNSN